MQIKHKLIAEVIKQWRSDSEERALAEAILYMTGLHLTDLQKMSTAEVTNVLTEVIRRPEEEKRNKEEYTTTQEAQTSNALDHEGSIESQEPGSEELQQEEVKEKVEAQPLSFIEAKKLRRGRKPNV